MPPDPPDLDIEAEDDSEWQSRLLTTEKDALRALSFNARLILENDPLWRGVLAYDALMHAVVTMRASPTGNAALEEWGDADDVDLRHWIAEHYGIEIKRHDLADAVMGAARKLSFHPIRSYLDGLEWDGTERLKSWLQTFCGAGLVQGKADGEWVAGDTDEAKAGQFYCELVGTKFLVGAVARVRNPGCKMDNVLILEGPQGLKKSTALKVLFGEGWFSDSPMRLGDKDSMEGLRGLWLVELAELDAFNKAESTTAKAFFSSASDRFRMPYGHRSSRFPRQCLFAGTTNQHVYLRDLSGNRRYWPVSCKQIDIDGLVAVRDQLWAEADHRYRAGEVWWAEENERRLFELQQEERVDADVWEALIAEWLRDQWNLEPPDNRTRMYRTAAAVMTGALGMDKYAMKRPEQTRVGQIMHGLGWRYSRRAVNGRRIGGYRPGRQWMDEMKTLEEYGK